MFGKKSPKETILSIFKDYCPQCKRETLWKMTKKDGLYVMYCTSCGKGK